MVASSDRVWSGGDVSGSGGGPAGGQGGGGGTGGERMLEPRVPGLQASAAGPVRSWSAELASVDVGFFSFCNSIIIIIIIILTCDSHSVVLLESSIDKFPASLRNVDKTFVLRLNICSTIGNVIIYDPPGPII